MPSGHNLPRRTDCQWLRKPPRPSPPSGPSAHRRTSCRRRQDPGYRRSTAGAVKSTPGCPRIRIDRQAQDLSRDAPRSTTPSTGLDLVVLDGRTRLSPAAILGHRGGTKYAKFRPLPRSLLDGFERHDAGLVRPSPRAGRRRANPGGRRPGDGRGSADSACSAGMRNALERDRYVLTATRSNRRPFPERRPAVLPHRLTWGGRLRAARGAVPGAPAGRRPRTPADRPTQSVRAASHASDREASVPAASRIHPPAAPPSRHRHRSLHGCCKRPAASSSGSSASQRGSVGSCPPVEHLRHGATFSSGAPPCRRRPFRADWRPCRCRSRTGASWPRRRGGCLCASRRDSTRTVWRTIISSRRFGGCRELHGHGKMQGSGPAPRSRRIKWRCMPSLGVRRTGSISSG